MITQIIVIVYIENDSHSLMRENLHLLIGGPINIAVSTVISKNVLYERQVERAVAQ